MDSTYERRWLVPLFSLFIWLVDSKLELAKLFQTKHDTERAPASVNREFELLSRIFTLAIDVGKADSNPCSRVQKFELDNERYRYLDASEETALMAALVSRRAHLHPMVVIALGLGLRKRDQIDFFRMW